MTNVFYIGGSPCSGKSTVAQALAERYGLTHFRVDDHLDAFIDQGAAAGWPICSRIRSMSEEETWMRDPQEQCREELDFYAEVAPLVTARLNRLDDSVIAEGAAFLPELMHRQGVPASRYVAVTPTRAFQWSRYSERPWVPHVLRDCSDQQAAFANWMERDALFAEEIRRQCGRLGYASLLTDGSVTEAERFLEIAQHFGLD